MKANILEGLSWLHKQQRAVSAEEFAEGLGIHQRSARRWLKAMAEHGFVESDEPAAVHLHRRWWAIPPRSS